MSKMQDAKLKSPRAEAHIAAYKLLDLCELHALSVEEVIEAAYADRLATIAAIFLHRR